MTIEQAVLWFFSHLQPINIAVGVLACFFSFLIRKGEEAYAIDSIAKGLTFCSLPSGVAFLICAAFPTTYASKLTDAGIAFFVGGLALILIPFIDIRKLLFHNP